jgi:hypothetical protein
VGQHSRSSATDPVGSDRHSSGNELAFSLPFFPSQSGIMAGLVVLPWHRASPRTTETGSEPLQAGWKIIENVANGRVRVGTPASTAAGSVPLRCALALASTWGQRIG